MKFMRSLPEMWARMMCPFPMSTLKVVLGRASVTTPSSSIISSFAKASYLHFVPDGRQRRPQLAVADRFAGPDFFDGWVLKLSHALNVYLKIVTGKQVYDRQAVLSGLAEGEKVIVGGLHKAVPGGTVNPVEKMETAK